MSSHREALDKKFQENTYSEASDMEIHYFSISDKSKAQDAQKKITISMFLAGSACFAILYCIQPILPSLSDSFHVTPAQSSLSLSLTTAMMAIGMIVAGPFSDAVGRRGVMMYSLLVASALTMTSAFIHNWYAFLAMRAITGLALSGVAAVAMTYISEEVHPSVLPLSMGLYISGNSVGSVSGRLITSVITDYSSWHVALAIVGIYALISSVIFCKVIPASKKFTPSRISLRYLIRTCISQWRDRILPLLFILGFILMGTFVTLFNYVSYRFAGSPYHLSQAVIGLLSVVYFSGTLSSHNAGMLSKRYGKGIVLLGALLMMLLGVLLTFSGVLWVIVLGLVCMAAGFFAGHSVASSWIGKRAVTGLGQASSQYLFCYYTGSSISGTLGGYFWHVGGWNGICIFLVLLLTIGVAIACSLLKSDSTVAI